MGLVLLEEVLNCIKDFEKYVYELRIILFNWEKEFDEFVFKNI